MPFVRRILRQLLLGVALGVVLWGVVGRSLLGMKYGSLGSSVTCAPDVANALVDFEKGLRYSALAGAIAVVFLSFLVPFLWRRRRSAQATPPAPPQG